MRTESQIRQKLKQVLYRNLQKRLKANFKRHPQTCAHNRKVWHMIPEGETAFRNGGAATAPCVCVHPDRSGWVCDEAFAGVELAKSCPFWEEQMSRAEIESEFRSEYAEMAKHARQGAKHPNFPVASTLLWVLGGDEEGAPEEPLALEAASPPTAPLPMNLPSKVSLWAHPLWPWNWFSR